MYQNVSRGYLLLQDNQVLLFESVYQDAPS